VFNDLSPVDHALDLRPFLRAGLGFRFFWLTCEAAYEIAPPVGDWNGERGLLEHRLAITFPVAL